MIQGLNLTWDLRHFNTRAPGESARDPTWVAPYGFHLYQCFTNNHWAHVLVKSETVAIATTAAADGSTQNTDVSIIEFKSWHVEHWRGRRKNADCLYSKGAEESEPGKDPGRRSVSLQNGSDH